MLLSRRTLLGATAAAAATTPRPCGVPPTITGFPTNSGRSRSSTEA